METSAHPGEARAAFDVLSGMSEVMPLVEAVRTAADREKDALGFLPAQVYEEAAREGNLLVAVERQSSGPVYVGHLLYKASFPHARIYQVFVTPQARRLGIARCLVTRITEFGQQHGYLSVIARVADDLRANTFWEKLGFTTARRQAGGATRKRTINVRIRELDTPHLFRPRDGEAVVELPFKQDIANYTPVFVIDLNVFFDVVKRRPRAECAAAIINAGLNNLVRIVVTEEFAAELRRNLPPGASDPALEFALQLPTIAAPEPATLARIQRELAVIVFPDRHKHGALSARHISDLTHLATAVYHSATGFVTADEALVAAGKQIKAQYGSEIIQAERFADELKRSQKRVPTVDARLSGNSLRVTEANRDLRSATAKLLDRIEVPREIRETVLARSIHAANQKSIVVLSEGQVVCAAFWDRGAVERVVRSCLVSDEDHPAVETALDALLYGVVKHGSTGLPALIQLTIAKGQVVSQEVAIQYGFSGVPSTITGTAQFQRFSIGAPVLPETWASIREDLRRFAAMSFPKNLPTFTLYDVQIPFDGPAGERFSMTLRDLETVLSPTLLVLPSRTAVLVPIRVGYADHLLDTSRQISLLPIRGAALFHRRVYYSAARNARLLQSGTAVVFYESGGRRGRSSAVAVGRVLNTFTTPKADVASSLLRHGVLDAEEIGRITSGEKVAVTTFDNVMSLVRPVPFKRLRALGCIDGANLVSAQRIDPSQFAKIIKEGMTHHA